VRKFESARKLVPAPLAFKREARRSGSWHTHNGFCVRESMDQIKKEYSKMWIHAHRAYPFAHEIHDFVASHERVYVWKGPRRATGKPAEAGPAGRAVGEAAQHSALQRIALDARTITEEFATKEGL